MYDDEYEGRLLLPETKAIYGVLVTRLTSLVASTLAKGLLKAFETWLIGLRARNAVDEAIDVYECTVEESPPVPPPVYSEGGPGFFDYIRLTAPWMESE